MRFSFFKASTTCVSVSFSSRHSGMLTPFFVFSFLLYVALLYLRRVTVILSPVPLLVFTASLSHCQPCKHPDSPLSSSHPHPPPLLNIYTALTTETSRLPRLPGVHYNCFPFHTPPVPFLGKGYCYSLNYLSHKTAHKLHRKLCWDDSDINVSFVIKCINNYARAYLRGCLRLYILSQTLRIYQNEG